MQGMRVIDTYRRKMAKFAACSVVLSLFAAVSAGAPAQAASLASEQQLITQLQDAVSTNNATVANHQQASRLLNLQIQQYDASMASIQEAVQRNGGSMRKLEARLTRLKAQTRKNDAQLAQCRQDLKSQLVVMYERGAVSYLSVLFKATSWQDFLNRMNLLLTISKTNKKLELRTMALQQAVAADARRTAVGYRTLAQKRNEDEILLQQDGLLVQRKRTALFEIRHAIASEMARHGLLETQIRLTRKQIAEIQTETSNAESLMQSKTYVQQAEANMTGLSAHSLLSYADKFMGTPYVWGGTSPSGFDCSGFVQYVFNHFGVSLPRTSEEQFATGVSVSQNNLQPGDLVFFSTYAPGATHVGIYMGNGLMIDAQDYGVVIDSVFNSYWGPKYLGARQVFKSGN